MTVLTFPSSQDPDPECWTTAHRGYWNNVANRYDDLYTTSWSRRENQLVSQRLAAAQLPDDPVILDLGCGTGLGATLVRQVRPDASYVGVDLSPAMLDIAQRRDPDGTYITETFDEGLAFLDTASVDCVLALFSTMSFSLDSTRMLESIRRVLKPSGWGYVSALGSASISSLRRPIPSRYRTRGDEDLEGVTAHRFKAADLRAKALALGLSEVQVSGMNAFSGVAEVSPLWWPGRVLSYVKPDLSHLLELTFRKPHEGA